MSFEAAAVLKFIAILLSGARHGAAQACVSAAHWQRINSAFGNIVDSTEGRRCEACGAVSALGISVSVQRCIGASVHR
jgi:hypothetical protein